MSFLYPNIITISRPTPDTGVGAQPYDDLLAETILIQNVRANIQYNQSARQIASGLPGDVARGTMWDIFFRDPGILIKNRDVITDEKSIRYQIMACDKHPLGYTALCELLQA